MRPKIHSSCYIDSLAVIIGDVEIEEGCSVYPGAVIRGDLAPIRIGKGSNIQENCVVHVSIDYPVIIGENVSLGHCCMVHGSKIEDDVLIGINSTVLNGSEIGSGSIIGANALVKAGLKVPIGSMVLGTPGRIIRSGDETLLTTIRHNSSTYHKLRDDHLAGIYEKWVNP